MYLEEYYVLKTTQFLVDKIFKQSFFITSKNFSLIYMIRLQTKKSSLIFIFLLVLLTFLNSFIFRLKNNFVITITSLYEIFNFWNKLILVLLPLCTYHKKLGFMDYFNLTNLNYGFKQFPLIVEIENIIELNKLYVKITKEIESKLIIRTSFVSISHKEIICNVLRLPIYTK